MIKIYTKWFPYNRMEFNPRPLRLPAAYPRLPIRKTVFILPEGPVAGVPKTFPNSRLWLHTSYPYKWGKYYYIYESRNRRHPSQALCFINIDDSV